MPLEWKTNVLKLLKEKGYTTTKLRKDNILSEGTIQRLREHKNVSWDNLSKICDLLNCQPQKIIHKIDK